MAAKKTLFHNPPSHGAMSRRSRMNGELRWLLYGAVPVVAVGLMLMVLGIWGTCGLRVFPDLLQICAPPSPAPTTPAPIPTTPSITEEKGVVGEITITPPTPFPPVTVITTAPISLTPPTAITTPPAVVTTPPISVTPPTLATTPPPDTTPPTAVTVLTPNITLTSSPLIDEKAVIEASELSPQVVEVLDVQIRPEEARGLDAKWIGGSTDELAGAVAPVVDENQKYVDDNQMVRQAMGLLTLNDPRLTLEAVLVLNKSTIQPFALPLGDYVLACHPTRPNDCVAVSLQGAEFQINPETVSLTISDEPALTPSAFYESGSIKKCYKILRRKICIRVFR